MNPAHRGRRLRGVLLGLGLLLALGLACELYFRARFRREFPAGDATIASISRGRYQTSPFSVYEPIRNTRNLRGKWRQNDHGFRNEEDVGPKEPGEFRVFLLGGSSAIGLHAMKAFERISGVGEYPTALTLSERLREDLERRHPGRRIVVFNAAVSGYRLSHEYGLYLGTIRALEPDLLVLVDGFNELVTLTREPSEYVYDVDRGSMPTESALRILGTRLMARSYTVFHLGRHFALRANAYDEEVFRHWRTATQTVDRAAVRAAFRAHEESIEAQLHDLLQRYAIFEATCAIDGVEILFCPQPILTLKPRLDEVEQACLNYFLSLCPTPEERMRYYDVYERYLEAFGAWARARGWAHLDLQQAIASEERGIFIDYCHFSPFGNEFLAGAIGAEIARRGLVEARAAR